MTPDLFDIPEPRGENVYADSTGQWFRCSECEHFQRVYAAAARRLFGDFARVA